MRARVSGSAKKFPSPLPEAPLKLLGANVLPMEILVVVGALGMMLFAKKKGGWQRHNDAGLATGGAGSDAYKM